jgi:catechol 2,3-dioxygenase-like lactoylglutathione lyase family enzyme
MSRIFGPVRQNGYVVRDIEKALHHWTTVLGVGPFFYFERAPITEFTYRGQSSPIDVSIALGNSGDLQIELIQQRNDAPSMYRDFLAAGREGLQHVAYWTNDFEADLARCLAAGFTVGQQGVAGGANGRFAYFDTETHPGTVVELSDSSGAKGAFFKHIAELARGWDGSDPIRKL